MSIATEITRIQNLKNTLRTKLVAMLSIPPSSDLEDCVTAVTGIEIRGAVNGVISSKNDSYTVLSGYHNGSGNVSLSSAEKEKIIAGNIKSGISILGVEGSYAGSSVSMQTKSVTPSASTQNITPDDGYDGLSSVSVAAIPSNYADVSDVTAAAADVLSGKIFVTSGGAETAGTMANNGAVSASIDGLTNMSYAVPAGYHSGSGTVSLSGAIETALAAL